MRVLITLSVIFILIYAFYGVAQSETQSVGNGENSKTEQAKPEQAKTEQAKIDTSEEYKSPPTNQAPSPAELVTLPMTTQGFYLSLSILIFSIAILIIEVIIVIKRKLSSDETIRFILVTLVVVGALYLITAGFNNNQIAPAIGLFGTISGYLLGKGERKNGST